MPINEKISRVYQYSLFNALSHRRIRNFGLGYEYAKDDTFRYRSEKPPVPLDDVETAILAWAGHGINGLALGVGQVNTGVHSTWNGRTHPSACNDQHVLLMIVNDRGVFAYNPPDAGQIVEIASEADFEKITEVYHKGLIQISDKRPDFTNAAWISANSWMANQPGSTIFFPVIDLSVEHINHAVACFEREKLKLFDERYQRWAGVEKWINNGYLNGPEVTMRFVDYATLIPQCGIGFFIAQNIMLACEAIGLGCMVTGCAAPVVLGGTPFTEGLGFRFVTDKDGELNPVGLDGHLESYSPPYRKDMSEAIDAFLDIRYGSNGILTPEYSGATPIKEWKTVASQVKHLSQEAVQGAKDFCNYVYDTYGRFPAMADTIQLPIMVTAHHVDTDFFDHYFPTDALTENIRKHLSEWHGR